MVAKLLCVGDMLIGCRPSRIPAGLAEYRRDASALSPVAAWRNTVRWGIEHSVDAVVLLGDVLYSPDDRFEAFGHLERGVGDLLNAGIHVLAVAGERDSDSLPRLAERFDGFQLLGRDGRWEFTTLKTKSGFEVRLLGWSFPSGRFRDNPLDTLGHKFNDTTPTIGLLHCHVDGGKSPHAPVPRATLERAPADAWLLGHVHEPGDLAGVRPIGYLGSIVGLDPSQTGARGPWLAEVEGRRDIKLTHIPIAPLRWEVLEIDAACFDTTLPGDLGEAIGAAVADGFKKLHRRLAEAVKAGAAVGCRVVVTGRSKQHRALRHALENDDVADRHRVLDDVVYFAESVRDDAEPTLDLEQLAQASDPPGLLARRLLALKAGKEECERLVDEASREMSAFSERNANWSALGPVEENPFDTRGLLLRAGLTALEELLAQDGGDRAGARR